MRVEASDRRPVGSAITSVVGETMSSSSGTCATRRPSYAKSRSGSTTAGNSVARACQVPSFGIRPDPHGRDTLTPTQDCGHFGADLARHVADVPPADDELDSVPVVLIRELRHEVRRLMTHPPSDGPSPSKRRRAASRGKLSPCTSISPYRGRGIALRFRAAGTLITPRVVLQTQAQARSRR